MQATSSLSRASPLPIQKCTMETNRNKESRLTIHFKGPTFDRVLPPSVPCKTLLIPAKVHRYKKYGSVYIPKSLIFGEPSGVSRIFPAISSHSLQANPTQYNTSYTYTHTYILAARSLCTMPCELRCNIPAAIPRTNLTISAGDIRRKSFRFNKENKLPPAKYSKK